MAEEPEAFFVPEGQGCWRATAYTLGPWGGGTQHAGPPSALLARVLESHGERRDLPIFRMAVEILRPVPATLLEVRGRSVRAGRNVELLEGSVRADGNEVMRGSAWRVRPQSGGIGEGTLGPAMAGRESGREVPFFDVGLERGYHTAMEARFVEGSFLEPGPAKAWARMRVSLVPDEAPSPLQRVLAFADSGNGMSAVVDPREHLFVNTDLVVHLLRQPEGEWIGMDARTTMEPDGIGLAETVLHDERGPIGRGAQCLFVAPRGT